MYWIVRGKGTNPYMGQLWKEVGIRHERDHFLSKRVALRCASLLDEAAGKKVFRVVRKAIVTLANPLKRPYSVRPFCISDYSIEAIDTLVKRYGYPVTIENDRILPSNTFLNYDRTDFYSEDIYKIKLYFLECLPGSIVRGLINYPSQYPVLLINNSRSPYFWRLNE